MTTKTTTKKKKKKKKKKKNKNKNKNKKKFEQAEKNNRRRPPVAGLPWREDLRGG